jgi:hypothetical protein
MLRFWKSLIVRTVALTFAIPFVVILIVVLASSYCPRFHQELKGWQTGIGAFLGFLSLLTGALVNAELNRRRDAQLQQREMRSLLAALAAEALIISQHAKIRVESINGIFKKQDLGLYFRKQYPAPVKPMIFSEAVKKIGILDPSVVSLVVHFYMEIEMTERQTSFLIEGINRHPAAASSEEIVTAIMDQCLQQEVLGQKMNEALLAYQSALLDGRDIDDVAHKFDTRDSDRLVAARSMDLARRRSECTDTGKPASSETPSAR